MIDILFLTDRYIVVKHPMDFGTMTKKLKNLTYKSKADFVADLDLIWSNCMLYNRDADNPFRRKASSLRKEADKLVPLIPDLTVRPRAEVEAEERRKQNGGDDDGADDSDDEPIMSSRGRKTASKGTTTIRNTNIAPREDTPVEQRPGLQLNGNFPDLVRANSDAGAENGTPPIGNVTPAGGNGASSHSDGNDIDGPSINGISLGQAIGAEADDRWESEEYKIWKQVTKKDRALLARERNRLFKGDKLNPEEPALLRTKAGMRRWLRQREQARSDDPLSLSIANNQESLSAGMDGIEQEERVLPDYYDALSAIPDIDPRLQWNEDADGNWIDRPGDELRMIPVDYFSAPKSQLTAKIDANMKQMQETRKLCSKITVIKQMQLQSQV